MTSFYLNLFKGLISKNSYILRYQRLGLPHMNFRGYNLAHPCLFQLLLLDLHTDFSGGRSGGLVFPSLRIFQFVVIYTVKGFGVINKAKADGFWNLLLFL